MINRYATFLLLTAVLFSGLAHAQPQLQSNTSLATAGYFNLSWPDESSHQYELQQANNAAFTNNRRIYMGHDQASVISGLPDGQYFYRVRADGGDWSPAVEVVVEHHPLSRAFAFFGLGAVMFIITLIVLLKGARRIHTP